MKLPNYLINKLKIYCGIKGDIARNLLKQHPLKITKEENDLISKAIMNIKM